MMRKPQHISEIEAGEKLKSALSKIGFYVGYSDNNPRLKRPDFIAHKKINGVDYKIAIEVKNNSNIRDAINKGINTLSNLDKAQDFQKLLLLLLDRGSLNKKNASLHEFKENNPTGIEILSADELEKWTENLSDEILPEEINEVFYCIKQSSKKLIELVAKNPNNLENLEWRDLERVIAEVFEGIGFKTTLTPSSKDGGKDVILECTVDKVQKSFIIEIKHWRSKQKVGQATVKEFINVIVSEKRDGGLYLSTYGYSNNYYECLTEKQKSIVNFGEGEKIVELCHTYEKIRNGIWNPIDTFEEILFENTISLSE